MDHQGDAQLDLQPGVPLSETQLTDPQQTDPQQTDPQLQEFATQQKVVGLSEPTLEKLKNKSQGYSIEKAKAFLNFQERINQEMLLHPVITHNDYTQWFEQGAQNEQQMREFIKQFSVFSNLFLIAQLKKVINAPSLDIMRDGKEILMNELGVVFRSKHASQASAEQTIVAEEGTVEGGQFRFKAAHFEWLVNIANKLNLSFSDIGKRKHGTDTTLFFCDELERLYGGEDEQGSIAAGYAVENWAGAGLGNKAPVAYKHNFWVQLVNGFEAFNERTGINLPISFFTWHRQIEAQHAQHTQEEIEEVYFEHGIDETRFIATGNEMLRGVQAFWDGLNEQRKALAA